MAELLLHHHTVAPHTHTIGAVQGLAAALAAAGSGGGVGAPMTYAAGSITTPSGTPLALSNTHLTDAFGNINIGRLLTY